MNKVDKQVLTSRFPCRVGACAEGEISSKNVKIY